MTWGELKTRIDKELTERGLKDVEIGFIEIVGFSSEKPVEDLAVYVSPITKLLEVN